MSSSSSQVDTFWISQKQICYFLFLAVRIKILDQSKTFSEKFISELYGLLIAQRIMISALPVDPWLVIDYCSAIITTCRTQPAGPHAGHQTLKTRMHYGNSFMHIYVTHYCWQYRGIFYLHEFWLCPSRPVCTRSQLPNFQMLVGGYYTYDIKVFKVW